MHTNWSLVSCKHQLSWYHGQIKRLWFRFFVPCTVLFSLMPGREHAVLVSYLKSTRYAHIAWTVHAFLPAAKSRCARVHSTDLLDGQAIGSWPDDFLHQQRPPFTLFEPILPGSVHENGTDRRPFGDEHPGRRIRASVH
jgi:hypothetical protein